ncbi:hypothetical protein D3C77_489590 [compost metagenome]
MGLQRPVHQHLRNMQAGGAAVDLLAGDAAQARHLRVGLEGRLLFGHGQHRTQVGTTGGDFLRGEGGLDIPGPAFTVLGGSRQQALDLRAHLGRVRLRRFSLGDATLHRQQHGNAKH